MPRKSASSSAKLEARSSAQVESMAAELSLHKLPGYLIRCLDSRAASLFEQFTGQTDLTARQFGVLLTLFQASPLAQTELDNRPERAWPNAVANGRAETGRQAGPRTSQDRDRIDFILTQTGKAALMKIVEQTFDAQEALLSPLQAYLRPVFLQCLEMLAGAELLPDQLQNTPSAK